MHKQRSGIGGRSVEVDQIVGDVSGKTPILIDDLIAGGSIYKHADALVEAGANPVHIAITHPVLTGQACQLLVRVLSIAPLLAEAIFRIHKHRSVSRVFFDQKLDFPV